MADAETRLSDRPRRLLHLHIPKTAGTALRKALSQAFAGTRRTCPEQFEEQFLDVDPPSFDFYSGHSGFRSRIGSTEMSSPSCVTRWIGFSRHIIFYVIGIIPARR